MELYKEMQFLHDFCEIMEQKSEIPDDLFSSIVNRLPNAMTYPKECSSLIIVSGKIYEKNDNMRFEVSINEEIVSSANYYGHLIVGYNRKDLSFTSNEAELIHYISKRIGRIIERFDNKQKLERATRQLEEKERSLEIKNIALSELLNQVQGNKDNIKKRISTLIQSSILPNLKKLENQIGQNMYVELLRLTISSLLNEEDKFLYNFTQLSQRELEFCYLIKLGLSSKEIAERFSISPKTVDKHRSNIRAKLGIVGSKKNLSTSLLIFDQG